MMDWYRSNIRRVLLGMFVKACNWWWGQRAFVVGTVIIGGLVGIGVTLLFVPWGTDLSKMPMGSVWSQRSYVLSWFIIFVLLSVIFKMGSSMKVKPSDKRLEKKYLEHLIQDNLRVGPRGLPQTFQGYNAPIDEVFIPLSFLPKLPDADSPLPKKEREKYDGFLKKNEENKEVRAVLFESSGSWQSSLNKNEEIDIAYLWQKLTVEKPGAAILGQPGTGKSTLMARLTLHMARCYQDEKDQQFPSLVPPLIPILIDLKKYAQSHDEKRRIELIGKNHSFDGSIFNYLQLFLLETNLMVEGIKIDSNDLMEMLEKRLRAGRCMVMFDGLDEVNKWLEASQVQEKINTFIKDFPGAPPYYNRFLITSRVAGYNRQGLSNCPPCMISALTREQITSFLPRWFRTIVRDDSHLMEIDEQEREARIDEEANKRAAILRHAFRLHPTVAELAEIPLLLTIMATMIQNSSIPKLRVELYRDITIVLLEKRESYINGAPAFKEAEAIRYLGPLAYEMQRDKTPFLRYEEVIKLLQKKDESYPNLPEEEAENFLKGIRERVGLFIRRTEDFYGFFKPGFQEYFAARFMLNRINDKYDEKIKNLIDEVRTNRELWREPFLLAVAYDSDTGTHFASQIIQTLLKEPAEPKEEANTESQEQDLFIAARCLAEVNLLNIENDLKRQIAERLLLLYQTALKAGQKEHCKEIDDLVLCWLQSVSIEERALSSFVHIRIVKEALMGEHKTIRQKTVLTIIANIAAKLISVSIVFDMLISPLQALVGLSALSLCKDTTSLSVAVEDDLWQLACIACIDLNRANAEKQKAMVQSVHGLHIYTMHEIKFVLQLVERVTDEAMRQACFSALKNAQPQTEEAWDALDVGKQSASEEVCRIVMERLSLREKKLNS